MAAATDSILKDYTPISWSVGTTYKCPYTCRQCMLSCGPKDETELSDHVIDDYIDQIGRWKVGESGSLTIHGGDPMTSPEKVIRTIKAAKNINLNTSICSVFMGYNKKEIEENVKILKDAGLDGYWAGVSGSHYKGMPKEIEMEYSEYMATILDTMLKNGIEVDLKNTSDPQNEMLMRSIGPRIFEIMGLAEDQFKSSFPAFYHCTEKYGTEIRLYSDDVMGIGRARKNRMSYGSHQGTSYKCPELERMAIAPSMHLYPDGNVYICCNVERGADFGFGNANNESFQQILQNIRNSRLFTENFSEKLAIADEIMTKEFFHLLPDNGPEWHARYAVRWYPTRK